MTRKTMPFDDLLAEAVDDALLSLGDSAKQAIYFHLENEFRIPKNEIPNRLRDFENGLETIFGTGAKFLEILIMKKLYNEIGKPLMIDENQNLIFIDFVNDAKKTYSKTRK